MDEMNTKNEAIETTEQETVSVGEPVEKEAPKEEIPEELAGLPEDIAREAMKEAKAQQNDGAEEEEPSEPKTAEKSSNSDTKDEPDDSILPNQKIPYSRFKHQVDKTKELEAEIEKLKAQLSNSQPVNQQPPAMAPGNTPLQQQPMKPIQQDPVINAEVTDKLEKAIRLEAMRMSGLDAETVDSIEYMDADDSRVKVWNTAQSLARQEVYRKMEAERQRQIENSRRIIAAHNENVLAYNKFTQEQMQDPDFEAVKDYATNDYFSKLDSRYQKAIAEAYTRIERNMGSAQDTMLIERYFTDAKNEYRKTHGTSGAADKLKTDETVKKVKQGQAFPRSGEISGAGSDGNITAATLEKMLETTPFEQIPEQYQRLLLGYED